MEVLIQLGVAATTASDHFALTVLPAFAWRTVPIPWTVLFFLLCVSASLGAVMNWLRTRPENRKQGGEATMKELAMLRAITANLPDMIYAKDADSRFLLANKAAAENMGACSGRELVGKTDFDFFPRELAAGFFEDEREVLRSGQTQVSKEEYIEEPNGQTRCILSTKVPLFDAAGQAIGLVGVGRNITKLKAVEAELKRARDELAFKAAHDSLTSLLNRGAILEMLGRELSRSVRENGRTTVLLGDLDHFKNIDDVHGHPVGDEVLREVANRLAKTVRHYDLVGRFGGEEFLVVLPGCGATDALTRADQLREAIAASPIPTAGGSLPMTISIGVLVAQEWGKPTSEEVLREVDTALYASKASGRNCCTVAVPPRLEASA